MTKTKYLNFFITGVIYGLLISPPMTDHYFLAEFLKSGDITGVNIVENGKRIVVNLDNLAGHYILILDIILILFFLFIWSFLQNKNNCGSPRKLDNLNRYKTTCKLK